MMQMKNLLGILDRLRIGTKLILMLVLPMVTMTYFAIGTTMDKSMAINDLNKLDKLSHLALRMSSYIHQSQKERGATAGFLGGGADFAVILREQRMKTDAELDKFNAFLDTFDSKSFSTTFNDKLSLVLQDLKQVNSIRNQVDSSQIELKDAIAFYTKLNSDSLDVITFVSKMSKDPQIATLISAYVNFLQGKERAGLERAVLANTFAKDSFAVGMFQKFISLAVEQDTYLNVFKSYADSKQVDFYEEQSQDISFIEVERMRDIALAKAEAGGFGVDSSLWFKTMTTKINRLKTVEDFIAADVETLASKLIHEATTELYFALALVLLSILFTAMLVWATMRSVQTSEEEGTRSKQMLEGLQTNILLANLDGEITYMNPASEKTLKQIEKLLPVPVEQILGGSYDIFHKNPDHQRKLLANPNNLPHEAVISLGTEKLNLFVVPLFDTKGNYTGPMVTWAIVTEQHNAKQSVEDSKQRLESTVLKLAEGSQESSTDLARYISSVVTASEELVTSIGEISKNTSEATSVSSTTLRESEQTLHVIQDLERRSKEIGDILQVINSIASQTNLLAVNATIESARAGDAGKGFAVVANEVKELSDQTAVATQDISEKISAIQHSAAQALTSISSTTKSVKSINDVIVSIASAVEEQSAVTNEIGKSMQNAHTKVGSVTKSIDEINDSVQTNIGLM